MTASGKCRQCGNETRWLNKKARFAYFCGPTCDAKWRGEKWRGNKLRAGLIPTNSFHDGQQPWNKGVTGIHLSPETEFKTGHAGTRTLAVGAVTIRQDQQGTLRAWIKVAEPNVWKLRAVATWESANGSVPAGHVVHHIDHNALNDSLSNLQAVTRAQHINIHRLDLLSRKRIACETPTLFTGE